MFLCLLLSPLPLHLRPWDRIKRGSIPAETEPHCVMKIANTGFYCHQYASFPLGAEGWGSGGEWDEFLTLQQLAEESKWVWRCSVKIWQQIIRGAVLSSLRNLHWYGGSNSTLRDQGTFLRGDAVWVQYFQVESPAWEDTQYRKQFITRLRNK